MSNISKNEDFISHGHAKNRLRYHFILSTKYRRPCLSGIETDVYDVFRLVADRSNFSIIEMGLIMGIIFIW